MGGGTQTSTSQTATSFSSETGPWKPQEPYIKKGFEEAARLYKQGAPKYYPGETLAGFDPAQTQAQQGIIGYTTGPRAQAQQMAAEDRMMKGLSGQVDYANYNPMADYFANQATNQLQNNVLPGIRNQMIGYQPGGGTRGNLIQQRAIETANSQLQDNLRRMSVGAYETAQDRAYSTMGQYPTIMNAPLSMYSALGEVGAQRRAMTQEAMNRDQARYAYEAAAPQNALNQYMSMITGNYGSSSSGGSSSNTTSTVPDNRGTQLLGTLGAAAITAFSDIHVKENIVPEGTTWKGLSVYRYNYVGDATPRRGVMAQQVERIYPDAVTTINGIKAVNYGAI